MTIIDWSNYYSFFLHMAQSDLLLNFLPPTKATSRFDRVHELGVIETVESRTT